jgi:hypothetical protein
VTHRAFTLLLGAIVSTVQGMILRGLQLLGYGADEVTVLVVV